MNKIDFKTRIVTQVRESVERNLANHRIRQRHRDGDTVRLWRCDVNGSSIYHFSICAPPGWLIMYGDMGECMWSRVPDMLSFVRGSIHSLDYFSEKASKDCKIKEKHTELVDEFLRDFPGEYALSHGEKMTPEQIEEFSDLKDSWDGYNIPAFEQALYESDFYTDCDSMPDLEFYTFQYLWKIEALKWFIAKLDAGDFLLDPYEWETKEKQHG